jgi:hypothetical protein
MADNDNAVVMTEALRAELASITSTQRAAVLMLLLGEELMLDFLPKSIEFYLSEIFHLKQKENVD